MTPQCLDLIGCLFAIGIIFLAEKSLLHILNQKMDSQPTLATLNLLIFQSRLFQLCMFTNEMCGRAARMGHEL